MKAFTPIFLLSLWRRLGLGLGIAILIGGCTPGDRLFGSAALNSRYTDEQPTFSGNGRFLGYISNRNGGRNILVYDLEQQQLIPLPRLNRRETIAESPSLSYTGRYIVYLVSDQQGRPTIVLYDRATQQSQALSQWYQGWIRNPSISPDGRYIVFESSSRGQWDIEVLDRGPSIELDIPDGVPVNSSPTP